MSLDYEKFILRQTEWRGEVTNKLDTINNEIAEIKKDNKEFQKEMRNEIKKIQKQISSTNTRVAEIAGITSIIVALITAGIIQVVV